MDDVGALKGEGWELPSNLVTNLMTETGESAALSAAALVFPLLSLSVIDLSQQQQTVSWPLPSVHKYAVTLPRSSSKFSITKTKKLNQKTELVPVRVYP